jgi:hypothetical protein
MPDAAQILRAAQIWLVLTVLFFGFILVGGIRDFRECYWLKKDAKRGTAIITEQRQHGVVEYRYTVDQHEYTGRSQRNQEQEKYRNVGPGEESPVYFSASHPWLSSLEVPVFPPRSTLFYLAGPLVLAVAAIMSLTRNSSGNTKPRLPSGPSPS